MLLTKIQDLRSKIKEIQIAHGVFEKNCNNPKNIYIDYSFWRYNLLNVSIPNICIIYLLDKS